jgi:hypothetical protein
MFLIVSEVDSMLNMIGELFPSVIPPCDHLPPSNLGQEVSNTTHQVRDGDSGGSQIVSVLFRIIK